MTIQRDQYDEVERLFLSGLSYGEIAIRFRASKNSVAGILHRRGVKRARIKRAPKPKAEPIISAEERAEREQDHRDLDMLSDLDEGHSETEVAAHWGVNRNYVHNLRRRSMEAGK